MIHGRHPLVRRRERIHVRLRVRQLDPEPQDISREGLGPQDVLQALIPRVIRPFLVGLLFVLTATSVGFQAAGFLLRTTLVFTLGLVALSAVWIGMDARAKDLLSPARWIALTVLFWPATLTAHLFLHARNRLAFLSVEAAFVGVMAGLAGSRPLLVATAAPAPLLGALALTPLNNTATREKLAGIWGVALGLLALLVLPQLSPILFEAWGAPGDRALVIQGAIRSMVLAPVYFVFCLKMWYQLESRR